MGITDIIKRNYASKSFKLEKVTEAIVKAMSSANNGSVADAENISKTVYGVLIERKNSILGYTPTVEEVQDLVEQKLMEAGFFDVAKNYILYRNKQD